MGWVIHRQAVAYAREYGWNSDFEMLVARIAADFLTNFNPEREHCWMAESPEGLQLGHIFLVQHPEEPETAKLRLLLVEPEARGMGLGKMLVAECIGFARKVGYTRITLWTQSMLTPATRIYQAAGFQLVAEEPHHSFGAELVGQTWTLEL